MIFGAFVRSGKDRMASRNQTGSSHRQATNDGARLRETPRRRGRRRHSARDRRPASSPCCCWVMPHVTQSRASGHAPVAVPRARRPHRPGGSGGSRATMPGYPRIRRAARHIRWSRGPIRRGTSAGSQFVGRNFRGHRQHRGPDVRAPVRLARGAGRGARGDASAATRRSPGSSHECYALGTSRL
jgi:hypothetical protein